MVQSYGHPPDPLRSMRVGFIKRQSVPKDRSPIVGHTAVQTAPQDGRVKPDGASHLPLEPRKGLALYGPQRKGSKHSGVTPAS